MAEWVSIRLAWRFGHTGRGAHFVQCNQTDCQYASNNEPPCPLSVVMFLDELKTAEPDPETA
jgi:hypothetical protein